MNPTFHLYGMKITLAGDLQAARDRAHLARLLMFKTKLVNVNNLDIIQNNLRLNDGTHVHFMSQHGFDSATIYVPPKPAAPKPRKRRWVEQFIWPAIEAYTEYIVGVPWGGQEFVGLVLCKGGGFEGPYEFVPKDMMHEDFPLEDWPPYSVPGEQPKVRNWVGTSTQPNMVERLFEDLMPVGITTPDTSVGYQPAPQTVSESFTTIEVTSGIEYYETPGQCEGQACQHRVKERTESYSTTDVVDFELEGDEEPGLWSPVNNEGQDVTYEKPQRVINPPLEDTYTAYGGGVADVYSNKRVYKPTFFPPDPDCDAYLDVAISYVEEDIAENDYYWNTGWPTIAGEREHMYVVDGAMIGGIYYPTIYDYTLYQKHDGIGTCDGSILSENEYALISARRVYEFSIRNWSERNEGLNSTSTYSETLSLGSTYDPPSYYVDGVSLPVEVANENRVRFTRADGSKYFQVGGLSIGLYFFQLYGDGTYDRDYMYGYAEVNQESGESDSVTTYFSDSFRDQIFEMTDFDGNPVYNFNNGKNRFRLIRETVTYEEEQ